MFEADNESRAPRRLLKDADAGGSERTDVAFGSYQDLGAVISSEDGQIGQNRPETTPNPPQTPLRACSRVPRSCRSAN